MEENKIDNTLWNTEYVDTLLEALIKTKLNKPTNGFTIHQGCKTNGVVLRTNNNLNLCQDPECISCRQFENLLTENQTVK